MGLALVLRIARLLGSAVTVRSMVGKGSRFSLRLPVVRPQPLANHWMEQPGPVQQRTVVVLDSDTGRLERTGGLLSRWGFVTRTLTVKQATEQQGHAPQGAVDLLIAEMSKEDLKCAKGLIESIRQRYRPAQALMVVDEASGTEDLDRLRAEGLQVYYRPMPPWRLRMILLRVLGAR
jgi:hypothetical protein